MLVTHDRGFQHQQNWEALGIACVILATRHKGTLRKPDSVAKIIEAIETAPNGAVTVLNL